MDKFVDFHKQLMQHNIDDVMSYIDFLKMFATDEETIAKYEAKAAAYLKEKEELKVLKNEKSVTTDGHEVELAGNIGGFKDVEGVLTNGGEGVGLFRTEFLYMDSDHFPTEDEQFEAYKQVLEGMQGKKLLFVH